MYSPDSGSGDLSVSSPARGGAGVGATAGEAEAAARPGPALAAGRDGLQAAAVATARATSGPARIARAGRLPAGHRDINGVFTCRAPRLTPRTGSAFAGRR